MKNLLIIYPHWPPSNLAGVHRARLIANFLEDFGWHPVVLTVKPEFYEEEPDWYICKTVSERIEVYSSDAYRVTKPRLIGDIGLRAFFQLRRKALEMIAKRKIDFIWIPIPSFYMAVLGRIIHNKTGVPYGIDYIDPWIRDISNRKNLRSKLSLLVARVLEPYAIKKAALISGVAEAYYKPAIERNFNTNCPVHVAMPYGFDPKDHDIQVDNLNFPWDNFPGCIPYVYAGAFLPLSGLFIDVLFKALGEMKSTGKLDEKVKLFFIGTGNYQHKSIREYAADHGVETHVIEIRQRFPYLQVLNFLTAAKGVVLIGSTEKHYTASKTYQSILSRKPVFAMLHTESSAVQVFKECKADAYLVEYTENKGIDEFRDVVSNAFSGFLGENRHFEPDFPALEKYSARFSAKALVDGIEKCLLLSKTKSNTQNL